MDSHVPCHPNAAGAFAKPLCPYRARQRKKKEWLHRAEFCESMSNLWQNQNLMMTKMGSQNSCCNTDKGALSPTAW